MLNVKGSINKNGEVVLQQGQSFHQNTQTEGKHIKQTTGINFELSVTIDVNSLISGIDGFVWVTKNLQQAEIIGNAIKIQSIEFEIVKVELENIFLYLIQVTHKKDIKEVIDFIQNDKSGLQLKPDWFYPDGEQNRSFEKWIKG